MSKDDIRNGDHVVLTGRVNEKGYPIANVHDAQNGEITGQTTLLPLDHPDGEQRITLEQCSTHGAAFHAHTPGTGHDGPAYVNCDAFREGWERTYGKEANKTEINPDQAN